jgi:hypothetical protein
MIHQDYQQKKDEILKEVYGNGRWDEKQRSLYTPQAEASN